MTRALGALAAVAILAGGCASQGSVAGLGAEVSKLRSELAELRVAQEVTGRDLARVGPQIEALDVRTSETQATVRTMSGELQRFYKRAEAVDNVVGETRARVEALTPAPPPPAPPGPPPTSSATAAVERPRVPPVPSPAVPPSQVAPPAPLVPQAVPAEPMPPIQPVQPQVAPPAPAASRAGNPEQEYNAALATFRSREHGQAVLDFIDFIAKYPKHAKAPDALVKIGLCHARLRDASRAEQAWHRVIREYPKSEAAALAQSLLRANAASRQ